MRGLRLLAISTAAFGLIAAPAFGSKVSSAGGFKYVSQGYQLKKGAKKRLRLSCPKGTFAYGGGQSNKAGYNKLEQLQSYPFDDRDRGSKPEDGWAVLIKSRASRELQGKLYAICGKTKASYPSIRPTVPSGYGNQINAPDCTNGVLIGGGLRGSNSIAIDGGGPTSDGWYAYTFNGSQVA